MQEYTPLFAAIAGILYQSGVDRDFLLVASGLDGRYALGEKGVAGYHLTDATPDEILNFVRSECGL